MVAASPEQCGRHGIFSWSNGLRRKVSFLAMSFGYDLWVYMVISVPLSELVRSPCADILGQFIGALNYPSAIGIPHLRSWKTRVTLMDEMFMDYSALNYPSAIDILYQRGAHG